MDLNVFVDEYGRSRLYLRITLSEKNGCKKDLTQGRSTVLELVRVFLPEPGADARPEEVLRTEIQDGVNPLCEESSMPLSLNYGRLRFVCRYTGSFGQAS